MKVKDQSALGKHLIAAVKSALKSRQAGRKVRSVDVRDGSQKPEDRRQKF